MAKTYDPAEMPRYYADLPTYVETKQSCPSCQLRDPHLQLVAEVPTPLDDPFTVFGHVAADLDAIPTPKHVIPGLDASLCRCPACTHNAENGTWHIDEVQRTNCLTKTTPFPFINRRNANTVGHEEREKAKGKNGGEKAALSPTTPIDYKANIFYDDEVPF